MTYEFQNVLFRSESDMLRGVAGEWLSAGGANDRADMLQFLADFTDDELALECIEGWGLDQPEREDDEQSWMGKRGVDRDDIAAAFARLRANFDAVFPAEDADASL